RGEERGILVVDDYGHHPEEIRATLRAAREGFGRRLVVAFQPHRFSRTRDLFDDFLGAFDDADLLVLTEIYPAGERPVPGVTGEALFQALERRGHLDVRFVRSRERLADVLLAAVCSGDLVLLLGAGDIYRTADELLALLRSRAAIPQIHSAWLSPTSMRPSSTCSASAGGRTSRWRGTPRTGSVARPTSWCVPTPSPSSPWCCGRPARAGCESRCWAADRTCWSATAGSVASS